jgi:hypothetical protein
MITLVINGSSFSSLTGRRYLRDGWAVALEWSVVLGESSLGWLVVLGWAVALGWTVVLGAWVGRRA